MLDADDPAKIVAVLDWKICTVGDPLIDVGLLLSYWTMNAGMLKTKTVPCAPSRTSRAG